MMLSDRQEELGALRSILWGLLGVGRAVTSEQLHCMVSWNQIMLLED